MKYDVIIIGSGLGGLQCGYVLAKRGYNVLILERQKQAGGCMQSYKRGGKWFDTGMHYVGGIGEGGCLYPTFKYFGLTNLPWQHLDPSGFDRVTIDGHDYRYAEGLESFVDTLAGSFPHQTDALRKYASVMSDVGSHLFDSVKPRSSVDLFTSSLFARSAYGFLTETFSDDLLINVLSGSSLKMELAKETLPLYNFAQANNSFIQGSYRLKGDGNMIVDHLVKSIQDFGGTLLCDAGVEELVERDGKIVAARCANGEVYEGDIFISDAHPAVTCDLVKESTKMKKVYRNRIHRLENTYGMFTVSLAIRPGCLKYFNWNQYIYEKPNVWDYYKADDHVSGVLLSCRVPEDGILKEGQVSDGDVRILDILTPLPWDKIAKWEDTSVGRRGEDYLEMKNRMADECVAMAEGFIPGLGNMVETRYTSTPLTYRDYTLTPNGSAYGVRKDYNNPMMTLLSAKTPIPNLLLTGQSLTLHGLLGVTMTTLFTVSEIIGKEEAWQITQTK